jgi:hypothetical protein
LSRGLKSRHIQYATPTQPNNLPANMRQILSPGWCNWHRSLRWFWRDLITRWTSSVVHGLPFDDACRMDRDEQPRW